MKLAILSKRPGLATALAFVLGLTAAHMGFSRFVPHDMEFFDGFQDLPMARAGAADGDRRHILFGACSLGMNADKSIWDGPRQNAAEANLVSTLANYELGAGPGSRDKFVIMAMHAAGFSDHAVFLDVATDNPKNIGSLVFMATPDSDLTYYEDNSLHHIFYTVQSLESLKRKFPGAGKEIDRYLAVVLASADFAKAEARFGPDWRTRFGGGAFPNEALIQSLSAAGGMEILLDPRKWRANAGKIHTGLDYYYNHGLRRTLAGPAVLARKAIFHGDTLTAYLKHLATGQVETALQESLDSYAIPPQAADKLFMVADQGDLQFDTRPSVLWLDVMSAISKELGAKVVIFVEPSYQMSKDFARTVMDPYVAGLSQWAAANDAVFVDKSRNGRPNDALYHQCSGIGHDCPAGEYWGIGHDSYITLGAYREALMLVSAYRRHGLLAGGAANQPQLDKAAKPQLGEAAKPRWSAACSAKPQRDLCVHPRLPGQAAPSKACFDAPIDEGCGNE
jgi:hypothetical protein